MSELFSEGDRVQTIRKPRVGIRVDTTGTILKAVGKGYWAVLWDKPDPDLGLCIHESFLTLLPAQQAARMRIPQSTSQTQARSR